MSSLILRPFLGYISLGLLVAVGLFWGLWRMEARHANKLEARNAGLVAELQRISDAQDRQRKETERRIREAKENVRVVERVVTKLESRPLPGQCRTPDLEEWRNIL